jgi:N-acetylneuraminate lyase
VRDEPVQQETDGLAVIGHVGGNSIEDARRLAGRARERHFAAISTLPPSYFKPATMTHLIDWCATVAVEAPDLPFYYYDIPSMTGVLFPIDRFLTEASARIPSLAGVKFTNLDLVSYRRCLDVAGDRFDLPWGTDEALLAALATGARGAVGSTYNWAPQLYVNLTDAFTRGDLDEARRLQSISVAMVDAIAATGFMGTAKALMGRLGVPVGPARSPLTNPTPAQLDALLSRLDDLGFSQWGARTPRNILPPSTLPVEGVGQSRVAPQGSNSGRAGEKQWRVRGSSRSFGATGRSNSVAHPAVVPFGGENLVVLETSGMDLDVRSSAVKFQEFEGRELTTEMLRGVKDELSKPDVDPQQRDAFMPDMGWVQPRFFRVLGTIHTGLEGTLVNVVPRRMRGGQAQPAAQLQVAVLEKMIVKVAIRNVRARDAEGNMRFHAQRPVDPARQVAQMNAIWTPQTNIVFELVKSSDVEVDDRNQQTQEELGKDYGLKGPGGPGKYAEEGTMWGEKN